MAYNPNNNVLDRAVMAAFMRSASPGSQVSPGFTVSGGSSGGDGGVYGDTNYYTYQAPNVTLPEAPTSYGSAYAPGSGTNEGATSGQAASQVAASKIPEPRDANGSGKMINGPTQFLDPATGKIKNYETQQPGRGPQVGGLGYYDRHGKYIVTEIGLGGTRADRPINFSDRRLKTDVKKIGTHRLGIPLYSWTYLWGEPGIGVMADEVEAVAPWAVTTVNGFKAVNYSMIGR